MKIVIDTNLYISALINDNSRKRLDIVLANIQTETFIQLMMERATSIETISVVKVSPDPKDDFLLVLCLDGKANYLLTGNKIDLLNLKKFHQTQIITLSTFLAIHS